MSHLGKVGMTGSDTLSAFMSMCIREKLGQEGREKGLALERKSRPSSLCYQ